jgi:D-sedoheptulose 7-phosphate isomerase
MENIVKSLLMDSIRAKQNVLQENLSEICCSAQIMIDALKSGKKILVCGNGGSAAQAQHFVAELVVRFEKERKALPAISLTTDTSNLTACSNDYGYSHVFKRQVEALGLPGDVIVGITTSGNSENVLEALNTAKKIGMKTICLNGKKGGKSNDQNFDSNLIISDPSTARIQEVHITVIHIWCRLIEDAFVTEKKYIFLDRDGTINVDKGYIHKTEDFRFEPGAIEGLRMLQNEGYSLVIVTNQSGIGRGYYTINDYETLSTFLTEELKKVDVSIEAMHCCMHAPEASCLCRKPATGLLRSYLQSSEINLKDSYVIGDKTSDIKLAENIGSKSVLVKTGKGGLDALYDVTPTYVAMNLLEAATKIVHGH